VGTWLVRCGTGGEFVPDAVEQSLICVDFRDAGDVVGLSVAQIRQQIAASTNRVAFDRLARMLWDFANTIAIGDIVVTSHRPSRQVALGRVTGDYVWRDPPPVPHEHHTRPVEWLATEPWDDLEETVSSMVLHYQGTVAQLPDDCSLARSTLARPRKPTREDFRRSTSASRQSRRAPASRQPLPALTADQQARIDARMAERRRQRSPQTP
jgi:predicted Mrr-cat superfamily restriction endonuclease